MRSEPRAKPSKLKKTFPYLARVVVELLVKVLAMLGVN